jgi:hypothetical protein
MTVCYRFACAAAVVLTGVAQASAQSTREEWTALRDQKQARQLRGPASTVVGVLTVLNVRFFSDGAGRLVGVGEARNDYSSSVSYARLDFAFYNASGSLVGSELTYVHGGTNALLPSHGGNETILPPGEVGFFKVWSSIPASAMSTYTATAYAEALPFTAPIASTGPIAAPHPSIPWSPMVFVNGTFSFSGQHVTGNVLNDDPETPFCPCGHDSTFTYAVRVSVAAYQGGIITDVQTVLAQGPTAAAPCDEPASTGMALHQSASFALDLERPADSIGRYAVEWAEVGARPLRFAFDASGGVDTFAAAALCTWTPVPNAPWIEVTDAPSVGAKAGLVGFRVSENTSDSQRTGAIGVDAIAVSIMQSGVCRPVLSPAAVFLGSGVSRLPINVSVTSACGWNVSPSAVPWLRVERGPAGNNSSISLFALEANLTGATRRTTVAVGTRTLEVVQNPGSRNVDVNGDGHADLIWQHQTDGSIGTWLMRGSTLIDGTNFTPNRVSDTGWKIVGAADLDEAGSPDLVWQHNGDGRLAVWRMRGLTQQAGRSLTPDTVADTGWKIRGVGDFSGDGRPDLVWQHAADGRLAVWTMNGETATAADPMSIAQVADLNWKIAGTGDFNGDGQTDLIWQHQADGRLAIWRMRGRTVMSADPLSPGQLADVNWKVRGVADINGDDKPDLLWQHVVSGDVAVWLMDGTTMVAGIALGRVPDTNWHIVGPR